MSSPWWHKAIIYELYVDKFAGNFPALTTKLDYFNYLGVNTLWILPCYPSPLIDGGYDVSDYTNIRPDLGSLSDFDGFITVAHQRNLKVIIDLVLNHTSDQHPWFLQAKSSRVNPKRDWYLWSDHQTKYSQAFVHFMDIKKNNWIKNSATDDYYYATFYPQQPDLNWDNQEVQQAMLQVVDFWLDRGVDGFRLDAIFGLVKREGTNCYALPQTHQLLKQIRTHIDSHYSDKLLIAESGGWPDEAKLFFGNNDECHLVIHFPLAVTMLASIPTKDISAVQAMWHQSGDIPTDCRWAVFLTNHDSVDTFFLNQPKDKQQFLDFVDPQSKFTNSSGDSLGARLAQICQGNSQDILWATQLLLSQPGVPIMYYGNEIGLPNHTFTEKPSDIRDFVRGPFDWGQANQQISDPTSLLNRIKKLIHP